MLFYAVFSIENTWAQRHAASSSGEDVMIAFYKTANAIPNFDRWIKNQAPYINTPAALRKEIHEQELYRLRLAYQNFSSEKNHLVVKARARMKVLKQKDSEENESIKNSELIATIRMAPIKSYINRPHKIDGLEQWVLATKIISVEFWKETGELLWEYTMPGHTSKNTINIRNLYSDHPNKKGHVKPMGNVQ